MPTTTKTNFRYRLESYVSGHKGSQHTCPAEHGGCGQRRHFTRYVDTRTGELLPEEFGMCNRADHCAYHLNPYKPDYRGRVYANEVFEQEREQWKAEQTGNRPKSASRPTTRPTDYSYPAKSKPEPTIYTIPQTLFTRSLNRYHENNFVGLLEAHFGKGVAAELVQRFHIGTSAHWPGANVFWFVDEQNRARGGQVVLFDSGGSTRKDRDAEGKVTFRYTWPIGYVLNKTYAQRQQPAPAWLTDYTDHAPKFPIPFGLHQLRTAPTDQPLAIVEAPATAIFCAAYYPSFIWLAVGGLDWLTIDRLAAVRGRKVRLFPDLSEKKEDSETGKAFDKWTKKAEGLQAEGFTISVSQKTCRRLEEVASPEERKEGFDLRDYLKKMWSGYPPEWDAALPTDCHPKLNQNCLSDESKS